MKKTTFVQPRDPSDPSVWETEAVVSAVECTGLIPAAVRTDDEAEQYSSLYAIHRQKCTSKPDGGNKETGKP